MDNWFTSKPLYNEMVQLGQYPYGTMEVKRYVPPFLKQGKTKKPMIAVPKGQLGQDGGLYKNEQNYRSTGDQ
eukprot:7878557-Ditylum_brightwellii.AAC.1